MTTFRTLAYFPFLALISPASAMISVGTLSPEKAKEMGITMKSHPNGDHGIKVWLEFKKEGFMKDLNYTRFQVNDTKGKHRFSTMLHPHPVVQGQPKDLHTVSFSAQKEALKNCTFMIVAYGSLRGGVGYILKVSDFLNFNIATIQTDKR